MHKSHYHTIGYFSCYLVNNRRSLQKSFQSSAPATLSPGTDRFFDAAVSNLGQRLHLNAAENEDKDKEGKDFFQDETNHRNHFLFFFIRKKHLRKKRKDN